jgi:hypothetical protein
MAIASRNSARSTTALRATVCLLHKVVAMSRIVLAKRRSLRSASALTNGFSRGSTNGLAPAPHLCDIKSDAWIAKHSWLALKPLAHRYLSGPVTLELIGFTMLTCSKSLVAKKSKLAVAVEKAE